MAEDGENFKKFCADLIECMPIASIRRKMAEDENFKKFCADLIECMPTASIQRKMKEDEDLKFADSDKCTHIDFDQNEMEDRELEIFSEDLFEYLFLKRLNMTEYLRKSKRTKKDPISSFHPHFGISVLCKSYHVQKAIFEHILNKHVEAKNLDSIAGYFTERIFAIQSLVSRNVFEKLRLLASFTLELCVFCYLQSNGNAIYYGARLYFSAFCSLFKNDFYNNGGWNAWKACLSDDDVEFFELNDLEISDLVAQGRIGWLNRYDRFITQPPLKIDNQTKSTLADNEPSNQSDTVKNFPAATCPATHASEIIPDEPPPVQTEEERIKCLFLKDCPYAKRLKPLSNGLILDLIEIISRNKDYAYKHLHEILLNETSVKEIMRYCLFPKMIILLKDRRIKIRNIDLLQIVKLILKGNACMAAYCSLLVMRIYEHLDKTKLINRNVPVGKLIDISPEKCNQQDSNTEIAESAQAESSTSVYYEENINVLPHFLHEINTSDQRCASYASEIQELLLNKSKAEVLLNSQLFGILMKTTLLKRENRWEDDWILSVMTLLVNSSRTDVSAADDAESLANKFSTVCINPQLNKFVPCTVTKTEQSGPTNSSGDYVKTCNYYPDTEQVENMHQNTFSSSMCKCKQCFDRVREKLTLVNYNPSTANVSSTTNENVDKELDVKRKSSTVIDFPLIDLHSEISSQDIDQTQHSV